MSENSEPPTISPLVESQKSARNWKKILLILLVVLFLVSLVGVGLWLLIPGLTQEPPAQKQATPSSKKDETADWKSYENKNFSFSFKYPANWLTKELSDLSRVPYGRIVAIANFDLSKEVDIKKATYFDDDDMVIIVRFIENEETQTLGLSLEDYLKKRTFLKSSDGVKVTSNDLVVDSIKARKFFIEFTDPEVLQSFDLLSTEVYFKRGSKIWVIGGDTLRKNNHKERLRVFDQILSTFKLL